MHELSVTNEIVAIVCQAARGHRVRQVTLELGRWCCVTPDAIKFCFDAVAQGTLASHARLEMNLTDGAQLNVATIEIEEDG
jgi:hydrogenase nickel incorporation protein HypA/HybF